MHSPLVTDAFTFASYAHRNQKRKGSETPYIAHPMAVAAICLEAHASDHVVAAALLHDVVEDCEGYTAKDIQQRFGQRVHDLVMAVTNPGIDWKSLPKDKVQEVLWDFRLKYFEKIRKADPEVQFLSAADKLHNALGILEDLKEAEFQNEYQVLARFAPEIKKVWERFRGLRIGTIAYYKGVAGVYLDSPDSEVQKLGRRLQSLVFNMDDHY